MQALSLIVLAISFSGCVSQCPSGWKLLPDSTYCIRLEKSPEGFSGAEKICAAYGNGSHLVSIPNELTNDFLLSNALNENITQGRIRIGLRIISELGRYEWTDKSPVTYSKWCPGFRRPTTRYQYEAAVLNVQQGGCWESLNLYSETPLYFLCGRPSGSGNGNESGAMSVAHISNSTASTKTTPPPNLSTPCSREKLPVVIPLVSVGSQRPAYNLDCIVPSCHCASCFWLTYRNASKYALQLLHVDTDNGTVQSVKNVTTTGEDSYGCHNEYYTRGNEPYATFCKYSEYSTCSYYSSLRPRDVTPVQFFTNVDSFFGDMDALIAINTEKRNSAFVGNLE